MTNSQKFFVPSISNSPLVTVEMFEGGFGKVFITSADDGSKYALKTLKWELNLDKEIFYKEAQKLLDIPPHKNVIQILDIVYEDGLPFICMPFCKSNLRQLMQTNKIQPKQIETIIIDLAKGLTNIHNEAKILHLDLKPENILIDEDNNYLLSDFGISKVLPDPKRDSVHSQLFLSGLSGTITYMSPEHFVSQEVTDKSDVFALGVILYELLTGKHPFLTNDLDETVKNVLLKQVTFSLLESIKLPKALKQICLSALNKNPNKRPSAKEIFEFLSLNKGNITLQDEFDYVANVNRANSLVAAGRIEEAERLYNKCMETNPYIHSAYLNLANVYFRQGKYQEAVDASEKLLELTEWDKSNINSLGTLYSNLSNYYMVIDPINKSIPLAKKAIAIDANDWQALGNLAESCRVKCESRNFEDAIFKEGINAIEKALTINPQDHKLKATKGGLLLAGADIAVAWNYIVDLINNDKPPHKIGYSILLVKALVKKKDYQKATDYLQPIKNQMPELSEWVSQMEKEIDTNKKLL